MQKRIGEEYFQSVVSAFIDFKNLSSRLILYMVPAVCYRVVPFVCYGLAKKITRRPIRLMGDSLSKVFLQKAAVTEHAKGNHFIILKKKSMYKYEGKTSKMYMYSATIKKR